MRKGFTLLEMTFAIGIFALVIGTAMGSWLLFMYKANRVSTQASLDMDVRGVVERFRDDMRNAARETIIFYPERASPYQAVGFALASDNNGDGLMDMSAGGSNILWQKTVVYHVWNQSPFQMRRTVFSNRRQEATYAARFSQIASVVANGNGGAACLSGESAATAVLFENLFTGKLWHAEAEFDGYAPAVNTREKITFGSLPLGPGAHTVNFTVTGKNPASAGREIRLDQLSACVSGWPLEAELRTFSGVSATPSFVGQGMAGAAYGLNAATAADGAQLSVTVYNDAIEECTFIGEGRNVALSNTVVRFDTDYKPTGFTEGVYVTRLDGQFGASKNWVCSEQASSSSRDDYYYPTNCVIRIPLMSDPSRYNSGANTGEPISYGIKKDGFGPVFRLYKSMYNGGLVLSNPRFAVVGAPASGYNSDLSPDVDASAQIDLEFYQDGVKKASWAACAQLKNLELRPAQLVPIPMGSTLMLSFQVQVSAYKADRFTRTAIERRDNSVKLPGCWVMPGGDLATLNQGVWSADARLIRESIVPTLEFMALNFADGGEYVSHVFDTRSDAGAAKSFAWDAEVPSGAGLTMYARSGSTVTEDGFGISDAPAWENVAAAVSGSPFSGNAGRYVQFRALLTAQPYSLYPGESGGSSAGPYRGATPKIRRALFTWDGEEKYVEVTADLLKGPNCGLFSVDVDGKSMVRGVTMEIEIFKDIRTQGGVQARVRSAMTAEVEPRNSGK